MSLTSALKAEISDILQSAKRRAGKLGRALTYGSFLGIMGFAYGCATTPEVVLREGTPNTLTYAENGQKKTVWDLNGIWDAYYQLTPGKQSVRIIQEKNTLQAWKVTSDIYLPAGTLAIKGNIKGDEITALSFWSSGEWKTYVGRIQENGNYFCLSGETQNCFSRKKDASRN